MPRGVFSKISNDRIKACNFVSTIVGRRSVPPFTGVANWAKLFYLGLIVLDFAYAIAKIFTKWSIDFF